MDLSWLCVVWCDVVCAVDVKHARMTAPMRLVGIAHESTDIGFAFPFDSLAQAEVFLAKEVRFTLVCLIRLVSLYPFLVVLLSRWEGDWLRSCYMRGSISSKWSCVQSQQKRRRTKSRAKSILMMAVMSTNWHHGRVIMTNVGINSVEDVFFFFDVSKAWRTLTVNKLTLLENIRRFVRERNIMHKY